MNDKEHLQWIHDRIVNVYGENENVDFLIKMREIIDNFKEESQPTLHWDSLPTPNELNKMKKMKPLTPKKNERNKYLCRET